MPRCAPGNFGIVWRLRQEDDDVSALRASRSWDSADCGGSLALTPTAHALATSLAHRGHAGRVAGMDSGAGALRAGSTSLAAVSDRLIARVLPTDGLGD